jgi:glucosamine 6-phosphate synthetase-like amidotransferase/phosphosugar isomerase protein
MGVALAATSAEDIETHVCGNAGYSLSPESRVPRTLAGQALLAAIAERGADAVGYAYRLAGEGAVHKQKRRAGASALLEELAIPDDATQALVHVRDYTKGHPSITANNHPIRHGAVVGIHNGIIVNDDELLARHRLERHRPEMTVDSEAIFALVEETPASALPLEELRGSMATAWLDERRPDVVFLARGVGRPLWIGYGKDEAFFASTRRALEIVEEYTRVGLRKQEVEEGRLIALREGREAWSAPFRPDRDFEERSLPAVRAPAEGASCLRRLAVLAQPLA